MWGLRAWPGVKTTLYHNYKQISGAICRSEWCLGVPWRCKSRRSRRLGLGLDGHIDGITHRLEFIIACFSFGRLKEQRIGEN